MANGFKKVRFHVADKSDRELRAVDTRALARRGVGRPATPEEAFHSDEAAARYYASKVLEQDERPAVRGLTAPGRPEMVPDLQMKLVEDSPLTKTKLVRFEQAQSSIPVFGSRVVVELDRDRDLVGVEGEVAEVKNVSPVATLSQEAVLEEIADYCEVDRKKLAGVEPPELTFFHVDESETWHLAYHFRKVSAAPKSFLSDAIGKGKGHGLGSSPRRRKPRLDFLVDAHDGEILYYYSSTPLFSMPVKCRGLDELDAVGEFFGQQAGTKFQMDDPLRTIRTFDLKLKDIESVQLPKTPVRHSTSDWRKTNRAAVSAHVNATRVYDFYNGVLMRDGIDGKGMELVSVVNCTYAEDEGPPQWHNAVWYDNRMWYGQDEGSSGKLRSFARFLDVIAHELTHGVTDHTSNLVYRDQSGALNESFSDIFGIIITNWYRVGPDSNVDAWDWELGAGLGENGLPLRDLSDPARTGDPDHMDDYLNTNLDSGGVHTNSNIHNKAAYNVLTAEDRNGKRVFSPRDVAVLYYLTLIRLGMLATFSDALEALSEVAKVYYAGDTTERDKKVKLIQKAYKAVGIE